MARAQLALFEDQAEATCSTPEQLPEMVGDGQPFPLRPHQHRAVTAILGGLRENDSFLVVMPTGSGKTRCATELARRLPKKRILFLAHRDELLQQAVNRFANDTGELVGLDQADFFGGNERIIVGSIQTVSMQARLERFQPDAFDLVIVDEAHHAAAPTYRRVLEHFGKAKRVGLSATPDRADEKAMGQVFDDYFVYDIEDAMAEGVLCPLLITPIRIHGLDLSSVSTTAGDLNQSELAEVVSADEVLFGYADAIVRESGRRQTLAFLPSVESARRLAQILSGRGTSCAHAIDGTTDVDLRRSLLADYQAGKFQYLTNCGIFLEGTDLPEVSCIAQGRPTKSRALSTQMIGRGLRPKRGKYKDCLVLEFTGNAGRHKLSSPLDILGGRYSDEEQDIARELIETTPGTNAKAALDLAHEISEKRKREEEEAAQRAAVRVKSIYTKGTSINPFGLLHMNLEREVMLAERFGGKPISRPQRNFLKWKGVDIPEGCNAKLASRLIGTLKVRERFGKASVEQLAKLKNYGISDVTLSRGRAGEILHAIDRNGGKPLSIAQYDALLRRQRQPGEE